jgi:hypothetical protein
MESIIVKPSRVRRSEADIRALLIGQQQSGMTVKMFCDTHAIHEATFYNWRNKYNPDNEKTAAFIPLPIKEPLFGHCVFAEIELPGKAMIRLFCKVDSSYLKALL